MEIKNFADINALLMRLSPTPTQYAKARFSLKDMKELLAYLGDPQEQMKVIHVAGTSGKTSTSYYVASLMKEAGKKVGLTVSPHVDNVNERIQVDLVPLPEKVFAKELGEFVELIKPSGIKPSYFAVLVAFAFWEFVRQGVEYAVIEVGMGGLLDATNVVRRSDKVCVITDIGFDHVEFLGRTLGEIASQKAGIIHPHNPVFIYQQDEEVMQVVREVAEQQQAELHEIVPKPAGDLPKNLPVFQRRNWYLANRAAAFITKRDNLNPLKSSELQDSTDVYVPARMEVVTLGNKTIIMDGAHNEQKLRTLFKSIKAKYPKQDIAALVALKSTKGIRTQSSAKVLTKYAQWLIITAFEGTQDVQAVSVNPTKVAERCHMLGFQNWEIIENPEEGFEALLKRPEPILLITGSFFLLNHVRPLIWSRIKA